MRGHGRIPHDKSKKTGLTQKCSSKAKRRRQSTEYGEALERRWGGFA